MLDAQNTVKKESNALLWLVAAAVFMETLDSTIVNTAIPAMARDLNESPIHMHAVAMSYALTLAVFIPASGWIADRFGIRRMFKRAIVVFIIGSICCAFSQTFGQLIAARVLQGIGGSMLLPLGRLAVLRSFPRDKYLAAISFVAIPGLIGPLLGPVLGGLIVEVATWHWIFLINIPIGIIGWLATPKCMPLFERFEFAKFDYVGFSMLAAFMLTVSLAFEGLSGFGLPTSTVAVLAVLGLAALISYILHASSHVHPLFSLELFRNRNYAIGLAGNLFGRIGTGGIPFLIPLLLQVVFHLSPLNSGLTMMPIAVAAILSKRIATQVIVATGYRRFLLWNTFILGLLIMSFALLSQEQPLFIQLMQFGLFGIFNSLQFSAMNSLTLKDLDVRDASSGNSLFSMMQMLALSFGVACSGSLLTIFTEHYGANEISAAFKATFIALGILTSISAVIFIQLSPDTRVPRREIPEVDMQP